MPNDTSRGKFIRLVGRAAAAAPAVALAACATPGQPEATAPAPTAAPTELAAKEAPVSIPNFANIVINAQDGDVIDAVAGRQQSVVPQKYRDAVNGGIKFAEISPAYVHWMREKDSGFLAGEPAPVALTVDPDVKSYARVAAMVTGNYSAQTAVPTLVLATEEGKTTIHVLDPKFVKELTFQQATISFYDAEGKVRPAAAIVEELNQKIGKNMNIKLGDDGNPVVDESSLQNPSRQVAALMERHTVSEAAAKAHG